MSPRAALLLPAFVVTGLLGFLFIDSVRVLPRLRVTFVVTAAALVVWIVALTIDGRLRARRLGMELSLRPQHYVQACAHMAIFLYWGWYWRQVYDSFHLIAAQLVFAY